MNNRLNQLFQMQKDLPNDPFLLFAIAKEYEKLKQMDKALEYYLDLQSKSPDYVGLYYHLGKVYEHFEKITEAFQAYTAGIAIAKKQGDQHSLSELAGARLYLGEEEDFDI